MVESFCMAKGIIRSRKMQEFYCVFHPSIEVVGICSECLRERLFDLVSNECQKRRLPELSSSLGCGDRKIKNGVVYYKTEGIRDRNLYGANCCGGAELLETGTGQKATRSDEKKGKKIISLRGFRSLFEFMKMKDCKKNDSGDEFSRELKDRSRAVLQETFRAENTRNSWISSEIAMSRGNMKSDPLSFSARESFSERRSAAESSAVRRSTSGFDKEFLRVNPERYGDFERDAGKLLFYNSAADSLSRSCRRSVSGTKIFEVKSSNPAQGKNRRKDERRTEVYGSKQYSLDYDNNSLNRGGSDCHRRSQSHRRHRDAMDNDEYGFSRTKVDMLWM